MRDAARAVAPKTSHTLITWQTWSLAWKEAYATNTCLGQPAISSPIYRY